MVISGTQSALGQTRSSDAFRHDRSKAVDNSSEVQKTEAPHRSNKNQSANHTGNKEASIHEHKQRIEQREQRNNESQRTQAEQGKTEAESAKILNLLHNRETSRSASGAPRRQPHNSVGNDLFASQTGKEAKKNYTDTRAEFGKFVDEIV